ncbi:MAG: bifunctional folylpolyglutamate synthase/dihydrofolate synthase [Acidobacteria bacterium]|nr:bifunctional folylpolyglutamate synthase/dihydrofolate synthase [Acidobacteriota bacterium]
MSATQESIDFLFDLERFGVKLGLENIRLLREALGYPDRSFKSIIVAGTNGKGSVAAMVDAALRAAGYGTGRFCSPHLVTLEERFAVGGRPVTRGALAAEADRLRETIESLLGAGRLAAPPTFFETTTAIALSLFARAGVDAAVLEVGMGGRFDATNVVTPVAAAIPSVDLDHQQYLGATLAEIAYEKAGVIKAGAVVVTGESQPPALDVLRRACRERGSRLIEAPRDIEMRTCLRGGWTELTLTTPLRRYGPLRLGLRGRHQARNAAVAVRLLEALGDHGLPVPPEAIVEGLTRVRVPGRLDVVAVDERRSMILDTAHNVAAVAAFAEYVREVRPDGVPLVFAALRDKDVRGMLQALGSAATAIVCPPLASPRALPPAAVLAEIRSVRPDLPAVAAPTPAAALEAAWRRGDVIGAAGSTYLVGEVMTSLALPA